MAEFLIQKCADVNVNIVGDYGRTALNWAAEKGLDNVAQLLIERNADVDVVEIYNSTAIILAAKNGKKLFTS